MTVHSMDFTMFLNKKRVALHCCPLWLIALPQMWDEPPTNCVFCPFFIFLSLTESMFIIVYRWPFKLLLIITDYVVQYHTVYIYIDRSDQKTVITMVVCNKNRPPWPVTRTSSHGRSIRRSIATLASSAAWHRSFWCSKGLPTVRDGQKVFFQGFHFWDHFILAWTLNIVEL